MNLRLNVYSHVPKQRDYHYCVLCGQHKKRNDISNSWRGHRTTFSCNLCHVPLCVRKYSGLRKSCWEIWHSVQELRVRDTPKPPLVRRRNATETTNNESDRASSAQGEETDTARISRVRTRLQAQETDTDADCSPSSNTRRRVSSTIPDVTTDSPSRNLRSRASSRR